MLVQFSSLAFFGSRLLEQRGFPLDDAWIHQEIGRNFAETGAFGFVPGKTTAGTSSPLWTLLQAANHLILGIDPTVFAFGLNAVLYVAFGLLVLDLSRRDGFSEMESFSLAALACLSGNFVWFVFSGMETVLLTTISVAAVAVWLARSPRLLIGAAWLAGCLAFLAVLTRPEGLLVPLVLVLTAPWASRSARQVLLVLASSTFGLLVLGTFNAITSGSLLPTTYRARSWLWTYGADAFTLRSDFLGVWITRLTRLGLGVPRTLFWLLGILALAAAVNVWTRRRPRWMALLVLIVAGFCLYLMALPAEGHGGRYQPLLVALFSPLLAIGSWDALSRLLGRELDSRLADRLLRTAAIAPLVAGTLASDVAWRRTLAEGIAHINGTHRQMGQWIREHIPGRHRVASYDIGAIAYESKRDIVDLGGLVDSSLLAYLHRKRVDEYIVEQAADFVVLPAGYDEATPGLHYNLGLVSSPIVRLRPIKDFSSPRQLWRVAWNATTHAQPRQILYRVEVLGGSP